VSAQDHKLFESGGLNSPFLAGELFMCEAAPEEFRGVAALQAEKRRWNNEVSIS
jgi:hypothetical protein